MQGKTVIVEVFSFGSKRGKGVAQSSETVKLELGCDSSVVAGHAIAIGIAVFYGADLIIPTNFVPCCFGDFPINLCCSVFDPDASYLERNGSFEKGLVKII